MLNLRRSKSETAESAFSTDDAIGVAATVLDQETLAVMLDYMPINVMMADPHDATITYCNKTSIETLKSLKQELPATVDPEHMVGQSIDIFHANPTHQRNIIVDPANLPWTARIQLGPETLNLKISAIYHQSGEYIGAMLTWSVATQIVELMNNFEQNVKDTVDHVGQAAREMSGMSEKMAEMAMRAETQVEAAAAGAEEATTNVQTVASAADELTSSIAEISRQVAQSARISQEAVNEAERTNSTVRGLADSSEKIGEVITLIQDIASQTNLLALNATIEAARAGEAGKGFAVVASEVKNLANQTARATEEIATQIGEIQNSTGGAVQAIQGIGKTINEISEIAAAIAAAVEEQGAATTEISRNVQQAADGTQEVSGSVNDLDMVANDTGQSAADVREKAAALHDNAVVLDQSVTGFLEEFKKM